MHNYNMNNKDLNRLRKQIDNRHLQEKEQLMRDFHGTIGFTSSSIASSCKCIAYHC